MKPPEKMLIYNLFPLLAGTFSQWDAHVKRASDMGFNWIFINPIQQPGKSGSLYSIVDYKALNQKLVDQNHSKPPEEQITLWVSRS
jgi:starch synthase (maltosyl-transferring)